MAENYELIDNEEKHQYAVSYTHLRAHETA